MDTLLSELKHHSTVLCSSSLDFDDLKPLEKTNTSHASGFFNFSNFGTLDQPVKSFDQMFEQVTPARDLMCAASPQAPLSTNPQTGKIWSFETEELAPLDPTIKKTNQKDDDKSPIPSSAPGVGCSYNQIFSDFVGAIGLQGVNYPDCDSREYYCQYSERSKEDLFFNTLSCMEDNNRREQRDVFQSDKRSSLGYFGFTQPVKKNFVEDAIEVNKQTIDFGVHLPGKILEECLEITNKSNQTLSVEVLVSCSNSELQNSQEYIYSIRSNQVYDFSERRQFIMAPNSLTSFKVALKVPAIKLANQTTGKVRILAQNFEGECSINLISKVVMPKIICPKQLYSKALKRNFINVAINKGKTQEKKISLKNDSDIPVVLELGFYKPQNDTETCDFECSVFPKSLTIPPQSASIATVLFKASKNSQSKTQEIGKKCGPQQKVLCGKAQDSSLVYSFALWVETF